MLDLLVPRRCLLCARPGEQVCVSCRRSLPRVQPPLCARCGAPTSWPVARCRECAGQRLAFVSARSVLVYDQGARVLVRAWKERGLRRLDSVCAELVAEAVPRPQAQVLTYVPADTDRQLERGHHPAERLARELGRRWGLPVLSLLCRTGPRRRQAGLGLGERRANARDAFLARPSSGAAVCLVDDVYTSGSTADAASRALRRAGAEQVEVIALARAVR